MPVVELVYAGDCPHVEDARAQLLRAFARAKVPPRFREWRADDPASPERVRGYGSPTILVDGRDIARADKGNAASCRLYRQPDGSMGGVPSLEMITDAEYQRAVVHRQAAVQEEEQGE